LKWKTSPKRGSRLSSRHSSKQQGSKRDSFSTRANDEEVGGRNQRGRVKRRKNGPKVHPLQEEPCIQGEKRLGGTKGLRRGITGGLKLRTVPLKKPKVMSKKEDELGGNEIGR